MIPDDEGQPGIIRLLPPNPHNQVFIGVYFRQFSEAKLLKMGKSSRGNLIHVPLFWQRWNAFERIYGARKTLMTGGEE